MRTLRQFTPRDPEYDSSWKLRAEILLDPFSIEHAQAQNDDAQAIHLGLFDGDDCVACLMLVPLENQVVKMRQVAVASSLQGQGLGRQLVEGAERIARELAFQKMTVAARDHAVPFYRALGYQLTGSPFTQVGIPHRTVEKQL